MSKETDDAVDALCALANFWNGLSVTERAEVMQPILATAGNMAAGLSDVLMEFHKQGFKFPFWSPPQTAGN